MKASEAKLLDFLKRSPQFVIPIYQRTYSWTEKECRQLWDDIMRCGHDETIGVHFVGSIVYIESGLSQVTHQAPLLVIDGQQRLTTVTLLLAALAKIIEDKEPFDGFSQRKITNYFLINPEETGDRHFKLLLSQTDKLSLTSLVQNNDVPAEKSLRICENFELFSKWLDGSKTDLVTVCKGLAKLVVVEIALNREQDNPQLIFESMNSTGKELSQADLIRNFILMGLEPKLQTRLYEQFWRPMELDFGQQAYDTHFDAFMRHYLTVKTGEISKLDAVYDAFKLHARESKSELVDENSHIEDLVSDVREYSKFFCAMALGKEQNLDLNRAFHDLRELKVDVSYPFLLELYQDYKSELISADEFEEIIRSVEAYVFRRAICAIPTNSMNKTFATFTRKLRKETYVEAVKAHFMLLPSYRRFPSDEEFYRDIQTRDLYNFRSRSYWLRRFENYGRKERVPVDEYTIEHILPQNEKLSKVWKDNLGEGWQRVQQEYLHTLGNLTLTGYNSEYSDRPFIEKRDMKGGFAQSPLRVNDGLGQTDIWNEAEIKSRASNLAKKAIDVWSGPKLDAEILDLYRPEKDTSQTYSYEDHPHLQSSHIRPLFEEFRKGVLALDPCVSEEILKLYVAYKAETNFVDVVPQARRLRLSLNMRFSDLSDPREICKDISNLGRWGNGDVEVGLEKLEDIPYILGLVRQALELQLGEASE